MKKIIAIVLLIALVTLAGCSDANAPLAADNGGAAIVAVIGGHALTLAEFNYYYVDAVNEFADEIYSASDNAAFLGLNVDEMIQEIYGIDVKKPLTELVNEQTGKSYADEMVEKAINNAARDFALNDAAAAAEFRLSQEEQKKLEEIPAMLEAYASMLGIYGDPIQKITVGDSMLQSGVGYGKYATVKSYMDYATRRAIADAYFAHYTKSLTYDDATLRAAEGGHPEDYNTYSYAYYLVNVADFADATAAENAAKQLLTATSYAEFEQMVAHVLLGDDMETESTDDIDIEEENAVSDSDDITFGEGAIIYEVVPKEFTETIVGGPTWPKSFTVTVEPVAEDELIMNPEGSTSYSEIVCFEHSSQEHEQTIMTTDVLHTSAKQEFRQWLGDKARAAGDMTVIPAEDHGEIIGYYAVYLIEKSDNTAASVSVRHLLVEDTGDKAAAYAEAKQLLHEWKQGPMTEDSFTQLVLQHTDDIASVETGGLYTGIHKTSSYVEEFLNWSTDNGRKTGDVEIIETEYGYHIMYFVGADGMSLRDQLISDQLHQQDVQEWEDSLLQQYTVEEKTIDQIDKNIISLDRDYE